VSDSGLIKMLIQKRHGMAPVRRIRGMFALNSIKKKDTRILFCRNVWVVCAKQLQPSQKYDSLEYHRQTGLNNTGVIERDD